MKSNCLTKYGAKHTAVWPNFFLMNIFFAPKGSKLFIIICSIRIQLPAMSVQHVLATPNFEEIFMKMIQQTSKSANKNDLLLLSKSYVESTGV